MSSQLTLCKLVQISYNNITVACDVFVSIDKNSV
jgi:hypothetical protein